MGKLYDYIIISRDKQRKLKFPTAHWPASLAKIVNSRFKERLFQKVRQRSSWGRHPAYSSSLCMHLHRQANALCTHRFFTEDSLFLCFTLPYVTMIEASSSIYRSPLYYHRHFETESLTEPGLSQLAKDN